MTDEPYIHTYTNLISVGLAQARPNKIKRQLSLFDCGAGLSSKRLGMQSRNCYNSTITVEELLRTACQVYYGHRNSVYKISKLHHKRELKVCNLDMTNLGERFEEAVRQLFGIEFEEKQDRGIQDSS